MVDPLPPERLFRSCDLSQLSFATTDDLPDLDEVVAQERAVAAVRFAIGVGHPGFNLFALGPAGSGKQSVVRQFLDRRAAQEAPASDWCYVYNFAQPHRPRVLRLPAGRGAELRDTMGHLVDDLRGAIRSAFESDEYRVQRQAIEAEVKEQQEKRFNEIQEAAKKEAIAVVRTPGGLAFAPMHDGEVITPEEFHKLPEAERKRIEAEIAAFQERLQAFLHQVPQWERESRDRVGKLNREVALFVAGPLIEAVIHRYDGVDGVQGYLEAVRDDVVDHLERLQQTDEGGESPIAHALQLSGAPPAAAFFRRYQVNCLVEHDGGDGAPVVYEDNPTFQNLVGRVEHMAQMGALITDFQLIKAGSLHRANGGYLLMDARQLLTQPYAWEGLKRALRQGEATIESLGQMLSLVTTVSLEPEPIPLTVKVVLFGDPYLYYLLSHLDSEFPELFKVAADFDDRMVRNAAGEALYARLIATLVRRDRLRPLERDAVARVIEHSARLVEDAERLSVRMAPVVDLLREADYQAGEAGHAACTAGDVQGAIDAAIHRADRLRARVLEETERGTLLIATTGTEVGQVNGLSVIQLGAFAFGHPSRITARVRLGEGEVVDIEREVELGGPLHSKGVLILAGFLGGRYVTDRPLSLYATLVFEQSYGGVEGDSASSAELYCLLSALASLPIRQGLAVTGSVNQLGQVQAIGGVNEKIEGFFDLCVARGLSGDQGVLIPAANVHHLMLRRAVVEAVAAGRFHIYPVATIDEGIELLTGLPAGARDGDGLYPPGTVNGRVEARLAELAEIRVSLAHRGDDPEAEAGEAEGGGGRAGEGALPAGGGGAAGRARPFAPGGRSALLSSEQAARGSRGSALGGRGAGSAEGGFGAQVGEGWGEAGGVRAARSGASWWR
ncbi:MAG: ATP-dependent protease [Nitrospirae bacterium CG06_land_8_20_14_3_00_70_43]|nr:MAG: ATP-dependent protease [Nitrospirae bacterium CG06_land_8_20_14_3_00_70_43]